LPVTRVSRASVSEDDTAVTTPRNILSAIASSPYLALGLLVLQPLIFYRRHLFLRSVHIPYDIQMFHLPLAWFIARCAREHILPLWDPFSYCGVPIHADIQAQLFYPLTWISILVSNRGGGQKLFYWLEWLVPLHMILGGLFAFFLFRKLRCTSWVAFFGATVYQIGPFFVSQAEHLGAICSAAWFPLTILSVLELSDRPAPRWVAILAGSIAMTFLCGFPATTLVMLVMAGWLCIGLAALAHRRSVPLCAIQASKQAGWRLPLFYAGGCALGAAIAAIQLLPTMQLSSWSIASIRYQWKGNGGGLSLPALASFFWPNYYHIFSPFDRNRYKLPYEFTYMFTYCGHLALALILAAPFFLRKSKLLAISLGLFAIAIFWMLGEQTPLYPPVFHAMPHFLQSSMYAESALLGFSMFAAIIAGLMLSRVERRLPRALLGFLVIANSWNLIAIGSNRTFNTADGGWRVAPQSWVDGGYRVPDVLEKWTRTENPPVRVDFLDHGQLGISSQTEIKELHSADGDNPFLPLRYYRLRLTFSGDVFWSRQQLLHNFDSPWIRALNVGYLFENGTVPKRPVPAGSNIESLPFEWLRGYRITDPMPRFYLANQVRAVRDEDQALSVVKERGFDPAKETVVEGLPPQWVPTPGGVNPVRVVAYDNNRVELEVNAPGRSFLVTSETLYPGWRATVNGRSAPILPTNVAFRGVPLEPGANHVVMSYFPGLLLISLTVSVLASALAILLFAGWPRLNNVSL
jgi:Bacterial membrane protein YfhO